MDSQGPMAGLRWQQVEPVYMSFTPGSEQVDAVCSSDSQPSASLLAASSLSLASWRIVIYVGDVRVRESPLDLGGGRGLEGR